MERASVTVNGVVQSVGFRPFVYRTAVDLGLCGTVRNRGDAGVSIEIEGTSDAVDRFLDALDEDTPPLARVEESRVERESIDGPDFDAFRIVDSVGGEGGGGTIPPDTAMCDACIEDMRDPSSRYYEYWATSCVDCGPRFTVIETLPYDRPGTSMAAFPMCADCRGEYEDPADRRYHAQTIACPQCGPTVRYLARKDDDFTCKNRRTGYRDPVPVPNSDSHTDVKPVRRTAAALDEGTVVVVKGIGGAHLVCDATNEAAVARLRTRTNRSEKPFALMASDPEHVASFAHLSAVERDALTSPTRPILLLRKREGTDLAEAVSPGLHTVGVMLPYSGIHHRLFDEIDRPLVMTSANMPGQPMLIENERITRELSDVADGFLLHDRRIVARCDDSVARFVDGERRLVRRSRGFTPTPVPAPESDARVLGLGPEMDVAAGVLAGDEYYLTQYVGDVDTVATFEYMQDAIGHLRSITGLDKPTIVAHDSHPGFQTTEYARRLERNGDVDERVPVQHHHAHAASVLGEHDRGNAIAITIDGTGYGPDGTVWGGEVLDASLTSYERIGGLAPMAMPGGDRAVRHPGRMLAGALYGRYTTRNLVALLARNGVAFPGGHEERELVCQQLDAGVNTPTTTSAGRFLDAVSSLLGACAERTYEGEPAMKLEALAARGEPVTRDAPFATVEDRRVLDTPRLLADLVDLHESGASQSDVAATAQDVLARGLARIAVEAATDRGRDAVALSGGVAYNEHITSRIRERVEATGLAFLGNERVPPGDGGISYGQAVVAAARANGDRDVI